MENKSTGKTVLIVILLLAVIGLGGYIVYQKNSNDNEINKLNTKIDNLTKQIEKVSDNNTIVEEQKDNSIVGYYKTGKLSNPMPSCESGSLEQTTEIHLLEDGVFTYQYQSTCDSADQTGTYTYNDNKLILTCDSNNSAQCDGTAVEYTINTNGTLTLNNGQNSVFNKVSKDELQVLKK